MKLLSSNLLYLVITYITLCATLVVFAITRLWRLRAMKRRLCSHEPE